MTSAANTQSYDPPAGGSPWGPGPAWHNQPGQEQSWQSQPWHWQPWHWGPPWALHNLPRPVAIAVMVLGFIFWWPVGLAILFYMIGSGRMGCRAFRRQGNNAGGPWQGGAPWTVWRSWCGGDRPAVSSNNQTFGPSSGNHAFDEYRTETLRRLEDEQKEFAAFLERLRFAKDKAEFDQFMTQRRQPPVPPDPTAQPTG
jgi:hypothetical protein